MLTTMWIEIRGLLAPNTASEIATSLAEAPFADGSATAHGGAREVKNNQQLNPGHPLAKSHGATVLAALSKNEAFKAAVLPRSILPMIFCRYLEGMAYGEHLDLPVMGMQTGPLRTDMSMTIWLSPKDSYDGGELTMRGDGGERAFKGEAGDALVYPSSTLHRVAPVTRGQRLVAITWIQSLVRDAQQRSILLGLAETARSLVQRGGADAEVARLRQIQYQLMRLWTDC